MNATRAGRYGATLVEVLVAVAVLAASILGWIGGLHVALTLLRRMVDVQAYGDGADVLTLCALSTVFPLRTVFRTEEGRPVACRSGRTYGFSLLEVMLALGVGAIVLSVTVSLYAASERVARDALSRANAMVVREVVHSLLTETVGAAGRGLDATCGLATSAADQRLTLRHVDLDAVASDEIFAALDSGDRPALYLRRAPHPRQPWIEDVTAFRVLDIGRDSAGRAESLIVEVVHRALAEPLRLSLPLPHRPCVAGRTS